jgi:transcriptional regulator with AAA-type ATPase domain
LYSGLELACPGAEAKQYHTAAMNPLSELLGDSPKIIALRQRARALIARHQGGRRLPPILIQGETGTGKFQAGVQGLDRLSTRL